MYKSYPGGNAVRLLGVTVFFIIVTLLSCEKEVHINLKGSPPALVVDGSIETGQPPIILLTTSLSFFSQINLTSLQNSFVHGASVQISDGSRTITLREYSIDTGSNNTFSFYSIDSSNLSNPMLGLVGITYTLTIKYNGQTYTSATKIPNPKGVDTMYFGAPVSFGNNTPAGAQQLFVNYTDPDTPGNYVLYYTKRNSGPYYQGAVYNDQLINGTTVKQLALSIGSIDTSNANRDSLQYAYPGDTITLKWCEIDKGVYTFWNSAGYASSAVGNPFASPINVQSNISNGALGVWAGYGSIYTTAIVPQ